MIGQTLGHYTIVEQIGAGGMGIVYRARDRHLERDVALKVLPAGTLTDDAARRRFRKEALALSRLNHPEIETVYDFDTQQGVDFLVMEYVEGTTLRERLRQPIEIKECLAIAEGCADALAAAHRKGIVHLDVKPENIMITPAGRVKVLDFGVAQRLLPVDESVTTVTDDSEAGSGSGACAGGGAGKLGGTPGYKAPEALLHKRVDGRADIFSLGVVLYEALTRTHPFLAPTLEQTVARTLHEEPSPARALNPQVPPELDQVVTRMLVKEPAGRPPSAADLARELHALRLGETAPEPGVLSRTLLRPGSPLGQLPERWQVPVITGIVVAALVAAAAVAVLALPALRRVLPALPGSAPEAAPRHVAVLPFVSAEDDPRAAALGAGLTEVLTAKLTRLASFHALQVIPASEVRGLDTDSLEEVGNELGAGLVLTGSLSRSGDEVRITAHLVDVQARRQLRSETVVGSLEAPFALEDRVAEAIVRMLEVELDEADAHALRAHGTDVAGAYELYLQGRGHLRDYDRLEKVEMAIDLFQKALAKDPHFTLAQAGLGMANWYRFENTREPRWTETAAASCREAIALDEHQPEARICLGMVLQGTGRSVEAAGEFEKAAAFDPASDAALRWLARAYRGAGRTADAEKTYWRAIDLRPEYWGGYSHLGAFYFEQARYGEAEKMFRKVISLVPDSYRGYYNLASACSMQGRYEDAIASTQRSIELKPTALGYSNLGVAQFMRRQFAEAVKTYREAIQVGYGDYFIWGNLAEAQSYVEGERAQALATYRRAAELARRELAVNPRDAEVMAELAKYHAMLGEREEALRLISRAVATGSPAPETQFTAAQVYNHFGDTGKALEWLEGAVHAGFSPAWVQDLPQLDNLRTHERLRALVTGGPSQAP